MARISDWKTPGASWLRDKRDGVDVVGMGKILVFYLIWRASVTDDRRAGIAAA
jgi:hypothetical protein